LGGAEIKGKRGDPELLVSAVLGGGNFGYIGGEFSRNRRGKGKEKKGEQHGRNNSLPQKGKRSGVEILG